MKRNILTLGGVAALIAAVTVFNVYFRDSPLTAAQREAAKQAEETIHLAEAVAETEEAADTEAVPAEATPPAESPAPAGNNADWPETAPDSYKVVFDTSKGAFTIEVTKDWAPLGAQRFYDLVREGIFTDAHFFRVVPGFVVQFGIPGDPAVAAKWRENTIKDDPVKQSNKEGTIVFATSGANSRTSQLFINYADNSRLDGMGFSPFGKVIEGMDIVKAINAEYGERPNQGQIQQMGNAYLKQMFPRMDFIKTATLAK